MAIDIARVQRNGQLRLDDRLFMAAFGHKHRGFGSMGNAIVGVDCERFGGEFIRSFRRGGGIAALRYRHRKYGHYRHPAEGKHILSSICRARWQGLMMVAMSS